MKVKDFLKIDYFKEKNLSLDDVGEIDIFPTMWIPRMKQLKKERGTELRRIHWKWVWDCFRSDRLLFGLWRALIELIFKNLKK